MTREQADQVVKEAIAQGWAEKANDDDGEYDSQAGRITVYDWDEINRIREENGRGSWDYEGCSVELKFPGMYSTDKYWVSTTEEWRKLKAKVDELKQIVEECAERGWEIWRFGPKKHGNSMYIEVIPRGGSRAYPVRVGGLRTWRKLCREFDNIIEQSPPRPALPR